jgi:hypothetical protein
MANPLLRLVDTGPDQYGPGNLDIYIPRWNSCFFLLRNCPETMSLRVQSFRYIIKGSTITFPRLLKIDKEKKRLTAWGLWTHLHHHIILNIYLPGIKIKKEEFDSFPSRNKIKFTWLHNGKFPTVIILLRIILFTFIVYYYILGLSKKEKGNSFLLVPNWYGARNAQFSADIIGWRKAYVDAGAACWCRANPFFYFKFPWLLCVRIRHCLI